MQPACLTPQSSIVQMTLRVLRLMMSTWQQRYILYHKYYSLTNALVLCMYTYAHDPPIQGIVGLAAYAYLLRVHGQTAEADHYDSLNKDFVQFWLKNASVGHSTAITTMIVIYFYFAFHFQGWRSLQAAVQQHQLLVTEIQPRLSGRITLHVQVFTHLCACG